jgi:transcriptional regulator with XRE-family HTH domain
MREDLPSSPGQRAVEAQGVVWWLNIRIIERARILRGWTKADLARMAHVDPGTLSDMTLGRRRPTFGTVQAVCIALGLVLSDVIVFEDVAAA